MPRTIYSEMLSETGWSVRELARRSGVNVNTLLSLSSGRSKKPQKATRAKLAAALRAHSATLATLADQLEA